MTEREKYAGIYSAPERYPRYGHSNHGAKALGLVVRWKPESVCDVGCGFNEFAAQLRAALPDCRVVGVDFACPGADVCAPAHALPFPDDAFDTVTAFDMLEHLREHEVQPALREMSRISRRFVVSISYVDSVNRWKGRTLHPTVQPEAWWMTQLMRAGAIGLTKHGRYIHGTWSRALRMPHDARVVLVGNGPSVLTQPRGAEIDGFDEIVRFNNFKLDGFEPHTGSRTTLWSTFFRRIDPPMRHGRVICIHENDVPDASCTEVYRLPALHFSRMRSIVQDRVWTRSGLTQEVSALLPTSGLMVATFLLHVVGVAQVHVVGFDHFSKARSSQHHYWLPGPFKQPKEHAPAVEADLFAELIAAGRVVRL